MVNASTVAARTLVEALVAHAVTDVVLCPGSRSAPLAYALAAADSARLVRLHVRHDERSAAFAALGLALGSGRPGAVVTTSGTAVANLHPAVLEAHEAGVPLLVITADRPHRLRGTWANQTTSLQAGMFGAATRYAADLPADAAPPLWRDAVADAVRAVLGCPGGRRPGPAHLDVAFDEPLVPDAVPALASRTPRRATAPIGSPQRAAVAEGGEAGVELPPGARTVVVAGAGAGDDARRLAEGARWPLLAEPSSGARSGPCAVGPYRLLLDEPRLGAAVERVVVLGRPTLSRPVTRLLGRAGVEVVHVVASPDEPGPGRRTTRVVGPVAMPARSDTQWLARWQAAGQAATAALDAVLDAGPLTGPLVAREVAAATAPDELLVAAASNAVRDLDLAAHVQGPPRRVLANRGLSGIDGTISTASGASLGAAAPARALVGDLAFLHDLNGLLLGPDERVPDLQVVVLNDDGGGIFGLLEHGEPQHAEVFERVFGTPHRSDLAALCAGLGVPHTVTDDVTALRLALRDPPRGRSVVEVPASRGRLRALHDRIRDEVSVAVRRAVP